MADGRTGTIVELVPHDALGWIELDDGQRVRFGGTACKGFKVLPEVGMRVAVLGTEPGFRGVTKATMVVPAEVPAEPEAPAPPAVPWPRFVADHPYWSDIDSACLTPPFSLPSLDLPEHRLFAPWYDEICTTAPISSVLQVPHFMSQVPVEPEPGMSFAHGTTAFLEEPEWPVCGACRVPLEMCLQLAPAALKPWFPGQDRGFVALYCFHCGVSRKADPRVVHARFVEPRVRVSRPPGGPPSASSGHMQRSQLVNTCSPQRRLPRLIWYRYRSEITPRAAASALFGYSPLHLTGPLPFGVDPEELEDIEGELERWTRGLGGSGGGGKIGGEPSWDQYDATPRCEEHGAMVQLLEYDGGQFLDGALHVFLCRACPAIQCVAEF